LEDGTIKGAEALIRWNHPRFGFISPPKIIELAASSGKILSTGDWLLREGVATALDFSDDLTDGFEMSINVSGAQFQQPDQLVNSVQETLSRSALDPNHLVLEITESIVMHDLDLAEEILTELTDLGVQVAVDDFGTGYSNFDSLINLPFDILKLDRSFIQGIHTSSRKKRLVESMVRLADALRLTVLVEGVEREEEREVLESSLDPLADPEAPVALLSGLEVELPPEVRAVLLREHAPVLPVLSAETVGGVHPVLDEVHRVALVRSK
jgi:EAL domain-containing protein (putative c-di-GMP-specific phosphodiesterase class I)